MEMKFENNFLEKNVEATLFWRGKLIWKGEYWKLHNKLGRPWKDPEADEVPELSGDFPVEPVEEKE